VSLEAEAAEAGVVDLDFAVQTSWAEDIEEARKFSWGESRLREGEGDWERENGTFGSLVKAAGQMLEVSFAGDEGEVDVVISFQGPKFVA